MAPDDRHRVYWRRTLRLTVALLVVWFVATFGTAFFARELTYRVMGWPFSFYMAAQGCLVFYLLLTAFYARRLRRLDREYGVPEADDD